MAASLLIRSLYPFSRFSSSDFQILKIEGGYALRSRFSGIFPPEIPQDGAFCARCQAYSRAIRLAMACI